MAILSRVVPAILEVISCSLPINLLVKVDLSVLGFPIKEKVILSDRSVSLTIAWSFNDIILSFRSIIPILCSAATV